MTHDSPRFPHTSWGCIQIVQNPRHPEHQTALDHFLTVYWKPVFYFLRAKGYSFQQAEDWTQEFFLRFALERGWVQKADPERGRFRTFLLTVLTRFLADQGPRRTTRQKQFEMKLVSLQNLLGQEERTYEPAAQDVPEEVFYRRWAFTVVENVSRHLKQLYLNEKRPEWFEIFQTYHAPLDSTRPPSQEQLARQYKLSRDQIRDILERVKKRFDRLLRAEIREQVGSEADVEEELNELQRWLGK